MIRTAERCSRIQLEFRRIRREVLLYHQCDLENDCVVEFTQIQTGQLLDLLQAVHQCITVYEQLTGSLRYIQIVLEELLDGEEGLVIQRSDAATLEHFVQECLAQRCRQMVDQTGDTQVRS